MADTLIFLDIKFKGTAVAGESTIKGYERQIELESINWGLNAKHTEKEKKLTKEVRQQQVKLTKHFDKGSTSLCNFMRDYTPFDEAVLTFSSLVFFSDGSKAQPVLKITLTDGYVEDIQLSASESGASIAVKETLQLSYKKSKLEYFPVDPKSARRGAALTFSCDAPLAG